VTSNLEYIGLLSKLNDVGLIVASEVFLDQNFIKMLVDNRDEINRIIRICVWCVETWKRFSMKAC
jgi:hypothetical protein